MPDLYLICITVAFFTSEFLPFVRDTRANGLVHALKLLASHAAQAFSAGPDLVVEPTVRRRASATDQPQHIEPPLRRSRRRHKRRRRPSPNTGCAAQRIRTRSADAISIRHQASLRHKAQEPEFDPTVFELDLDSPLSATPPDSPVAASPVPYSPTQGPAAPPAIELTPMMHTVV
jgi:hypothetical protein